MWAHSVHHHPPPSAYRPSPVILIIIVVLVVFVLFGSFLSVYFCKCLSQNFLYTWHFRHSPSGGTPDRPAGSTAAPPPPPGLHPSIIQSFPTFPYSSVKDYRRERYGLECAICLVEFRDDDMLRLLTVCCHVFHQECIDLWFESHTTCPVCRRSLDSPEKSPEKSSASLHIAIHGIHENESVEDAVSITIKGENEKDNERGGKGGGDLAAAFGQVEGHNEAERFSRSHSTGHSLLRIGKEEEEEEEEEEEDRFTLRLPEHVKAKILGHKGTRSCTTFGEYKSKISTGNGGFGEVSGLSGGAINKE